MSEPDSAGSPGAPMPAAVDGSGSSARLMVSPAQSARWRVDQPPPRVGNPDASLSAPWPDSGVAARHACVVRDGWPGNAGRLPARSACGPLANTSSRNSGCLDHSGCISPRLCGIPRTGSVFQEVPSATRANGSRRQRPLRDILCMQRRLLATGAALVLTWSLGPASRQHLPPAGQLSTSSAPPLPRCACQTVRSLRDHTAGSPAGSKPQNRYIHT
jgi:hypothetical protein